jgi:menaquinone-dependent protoporphyrinogen oxidase
MGNRLLIVYATRYGQTARIAARIGAALSGRGLAVDLRAADALDGAGTLAPYAGVVVGGPIYLQKLPESIERFARRHRHELARIPSSLFVVGLADTSRAPDGRRQTDEAIDVFLRRTALRPERVARFAGALAYTQYGLFTRLLMKAITRRAGGPTDTRRDHDLTDWGAVDRFAAELAGAAAAASAPAPAPTSA